MGPLNGRRDLTLDDETAIRAVQAWVMEFVVGEDLCPFARRELENARVRFTVTSSRTEGALAAALTDELEFMEANPTLETTLLIHPHVLETFADYNQFLDLADALIEDLGLTGVFQVASFHPEYQFADTAPEDAENYSNRSPLPMLHLLREASIEKAVDRFDDIDQIPERNIRHLQQIGTPELQRRWLGCLPDQAPD